MDVDGLNGIDEIVAADLEEDVERPRSRKAIGGPCRTVAGSRAWIGNVEAEPNGGLDNSSLAFGTNG